jgi:NTP pyrophosphatase (non-canonical NTP hydrolase)
MRKSLQLKVLKGAIKKYGNARQMDMVVEESAELIKAINKFKRSPGAVTMRDLCGELADVEIMCQQLRLMLNKDGLINQIKNEKLVRLQSRL